MKKPKKKWRFAIGTTSRVPKSSRHYVIFDVDNRRADKAIRRLQRIQKCQIFLQRTNHGWHIYTNITRSFSGVIRIASGIADAAWLRIGKSRGYFFLADKSEVILPWPVERMVIHHAKSHNAR